MYERILGLVKDCPPSRKMVVPVMYLEPSHIKYMMVDAISFFTSSHLCIGTTSFTSFSALSFPSDTGYASSRCKPRAIALTLILYLPISCCIPAEHEPYAAAPL
ncbi:hypothetical protein OIU78_025950 [Salix suchowensis]|nr:hypothetical protein OIU78_025950 [Salix suchowensis]